MSSDDLEIIGFDPLNAETPQSRLAESITPPESVYVRTNFGVPRLDADHHEIQIDGAVAAPFAIDVSELRQMPRISYANTMECAGNDRLSMRPVPRGEPWKGGAISTTSWTGVPLRDVLARASIADDAVEILVEGADCGERADADGKGPVRFARALPIADALAPQTLLALEMNGAPLTPVHGAPVRLVVPGWYGMASVKWVTRLSVLTTPYAGYFQTRRYVYKQGALIEPVRRMRVKSIIVAPADGVVANMGTLRVWGWAWSGDGTIERVEVAAGDGAWQPATLDARTSSHSWVRWQREITLERPGRLVLRSRAIDSSGAAQPDVAAWNELGYGNNAIQATIIDVRR